ncbi:sigma-70 family RNA polymerase sigma factor [bacterium]|nr:sigma-70 family RNA polymerase sigma factor [bacterium]
MQDDSAYLSLPDPDLVKKIRTSDRDAFQTLYFRYYESLFRFLWYRLKPADLVRDLLQDLFLKLWNNRSRLDASKSIKAYLYQSAHHLMIDVLRRKKSDVTYRDHRTETLPDPDSADRRIILQEAVDSLPPKLRLVWTLSQVDGFKYKEIAEICQISVKTVEYRMAKALMLLRKLLS